MALSLMAAPLPDPAAAGEADSRWTEAAAAFVHEATGVPAPATPLRRVSGAHLEAAVFAGMPLRGDRPKVGAAFDPVRGEILVAADLDLSRALDLSFVVHEMVHAQQDAVGTPRQTLCPGRLEGEAYAVQARFLRAHGLNQDAFLTDLLGMLQSACSTVD